MAVFATDLIVALQEDRPGTLARAAEAVANAGINIDGWAEVAGILHVLAQDPAGARRALEAGGFHVRAEEPVVVVAVEDRPGTAAHVFKTIADAGVNVRFTYLATNNRLVIAADDLQKIADVV